MEAGGRDGVTGSRLSKKHYVGQRVVDLVGHLSPKNCLEMSSAIFLATTSIAPIKASTSSSDLSGVVKS